MVGARDLLFAGRSNALPAFLCKLPIACIGVRLFNVAAVRQLTDGNKDGGERLALCLLPQRHDRLRTVHVDGGEKGGVERGQDRDIGGSGDRGIGHAPTSTTSAV